MKLKNETYDALKYLAQIVLPALATLYFAISQIWGLPCGEEIVGTITAIDAFLGALLGLSKSRYEDEQYQVAIYTQEELEKKTKVELMTIAFELSIPTSNKLTKKEIIEDILSNQ